MSRDVNCTMAVMPGGIVPPRRLLLRLNMLSWVNFVTPSMPEPVRLLELKSSAVKPVQAVMLVGSVPVKGFDRRSRPAREVVPEQRTPTQLLVHGSPVSQLVLVVQLAPPVAEYRLTKASRWFVGSTPSAEGSHPGATRAVTATTMKTAGLRTVRSASPC